MKQHSLRRLGLMLAFGGLALGAMAQQQPAPAPFTETLNVEVANVEVFVTDKQGRPVTGLGKEDFELFVDSERTPIANFYAATDGRPALPTPPPLTTDAPSVAETTAPAPATQRLHVAVVVDNDHIRAVNRKRAFRELRSFLSTRLREDDRVTIISLDPEPTFHSDFSTDRRAAGALLDHIERTSARPSYQDNERRQILNELSTTGRVYNRRDYVDGSGPDSGALVARIRAYAESEFIRSQATLQTLGQLVNSLAGVAGRKALLHVSDGIPNRPGEEMFAAWSYRYGDQAPAAQGLRSGGLATDYIREIGRFDLVRSIEELGRLANAARITWYSLDAEVDHTGSLRSASGAGGVASEALDALETNLREPLELAATLTGGRRIQASHRLADDLAKIATDFGTYYSLGFVPTASSEPATGKKASRNIRVKVRGKGLLVRHRDSWQAKASDERSAERVTAALLYHAVANPLALEIGFGAPQRREDGNYTLPVEVVIPLANLLLVPRGDVHAAQLSLFVTTRDSKGQARRIQKLPFNAAIPADKLTEALGQSARYTLPAVVRPGDQQLALGVRDDFGSTESYVRLDLTGLDLTGLDLTGLDLTGLDLGDRKP